MTLQLLHAPARGHRASALLLLGLAAAGHAQDVCGTSGLTEIVSTDEAGQVGVDSSLYPSISEDGRYVAFESESPLLPEDPNSSADIYVKDRLTGAVVCASTTLGGVYGNEPSGSPAISADGRWLVFTSESTNFGPLDTNGTTDVYRKDLWTGALDRVSNVHLGATAGNGQSLSPSISDDGRYVVFVSGSTDLIANDTNGYSDVFMRDMLTGETVRVSNGLLGQANGQSIDPRISGDGTRVAFASLASNLVIGDLNGIFDVFVVEPGSNTVLVSRTPGGQSGNGVSGSPSISSDGSRVAFDSGASDLVALDWNVNTDVFCLDVDTLTMERVSLTSDQLPVNQAAVNPEISRDGRVVAFTSWGAFGPVSELGAPSHVFARDLATDRTYTVSRPSGAAPFTIAGCSAPALAQGGAIIAFHSNWSGFVPGDTNGTADVFLRTMHPDPFSYGTGKVTSAGCLPTLSATGFASVADQTPFALSGDELPNQKQAVLFYGLAGQASIPFHGATLSVAPPLARTPLLQTSGSAPPASDCTGFFAFDMNAFAAGLAGGNPRPELSIVGQQINVQCWGRDTPISTFLTSAVQYVVGP